ncbi:hypothetical protein ABH15_04930 [Methanoculleus taiwanensis]|uniref:Uncharacterized protein n=1 Tax=Methanoculleus taiwanensis TaxID=1550565 RepID=A0A498GZQ3_9EURY|nr:hypothetical protein [Methanoculleus taiwanensis]RXE55607.1 hypothetical protein ABH15_04930 [Methanoculleus taiwanensis]
MVTLRLLAMDDVSFHSWTCCNASGDVWVFFKEKHLFPEFLKHFYSMWGEDREAMPSSENFF